MKREKSEEEKKRTKGGERRLRTSSSDSNLGGSLVPDKGLSSSSVAVVDVDGGSREGRSWKRNKVSSS